MYSQPFSLAALSNLSTFAYDADGNRLLTVLPNGVKVYTPFPDYEETVPTSGATTQRTTYSLGGQLIAIRVRAGTTGNGVFYYAYTDHLGSVVAWTNASGAMVGSSLARYEPFGTYRTKPAAAVNPDISDRGFTGHRQNNTGVYDLRLSYMNARWARQSRPTINLNHEASTDFTDATKSA